MKPSMKSDGNCFEVAACIVGGLPETGPGAEKAISLLSTIGDDVKSMKVCHGYVTRRADGLRHVHAWVEFMLAGQHQMVVDYSNGHECFTTAYIYYQSGDIDPLDVIRYDEMGVSNEIVKTEHWGPWHKKFEKLTLSVVA